MMCQKHTFLHQKSTTGKWSTFRKRSIFGSVLQVRFHFFVSFLSVVHTKWPEGHPCPAGVIQLSEFHDSLNLMNADTNIFHLNCGTQPNATPPTMETEQREESDVSGSVHESCRNMINQVRQNTLDFSVMLRSQNHHQGGLVDSMDI